MPAFQFCCCGPLEMLMGPEPDLYLFPEDKGIKISTIGRKRGWEGGQKGGSRESRNQFSPGKAFRIFGGEKWKTLGQTSGHNRNEEEMKKQDGIGWRFACAVYCSRHKIFADRGNTVFICACV